MTCPGLGDTFVENGSPLLLNGSFDLDPTFDDTCGGDLGVFFFAEVVTGSVGVAPAAATFFGDAAGGFTGEASESGGFFSAILCAPAGTVVGDIAGARFLSEAGPSTNVICGLTE